MPEHPNDVRTDAKPHRSLFERLTALISPEPENRAELLEVLHDAHERNLIDADALSMIEGVFQVSDLSARDIMVPRSQMDVIDISKPIEEWMPNVLATAHSRFPAIEGERDKVVGILLAKDLLRYYAEESFDVRDMLRPAIFIPESKRLNVLLRDFRANHNHMAIVVDEYSGVAGLITIEDVLEQIVGDIEDEYDFDEEEDNVLSIKEGQLGPRWRVKALTELEQFNEEIGAGAGRRGRRHHRRPGRQPPRPHAAQGRRCSTSTTCASKCCAPTPARSTCCWSSACRRPRTNTTDAAPSPRSPVNFAGATPRSTAWPMLWAALAGGLSLFTFAPFGSWPLQFPLLAFLFYQVGMDTSVRRAGWIGWAFGLGWSVAGMHWLYIAMNRFGGLAAPLAALAILLLGAYMGLFAAFATGFAAWLRRRWSLPVASFLMLVLPVTWGLSEWMRGWVFTGFPWAASGYAHHASPLSGFAPLIGVYGIGVLVALCGSCLAMLTQRGRWPAIGLLCAIMAAGFGLKHIDWTAPARRADLGAPAAG